MGFDMSIFEADEPTFEDIVAVRAERQRMVTDFLATATSELLAEERDNPWGGGDWHPTARQKGWRPADESLSPTHVAIRRPLLTKGQRHG